MVPTKLRIWGVRPKSLQKHTDVVNVQIGPTCGPDDEGCARSPAVLQVQSFGYQVFVSEDDARGVPHGQLVVLDATEDVCGVVPRQAVNHAPCRSGNTHVYVHGCSHAPFSFFPPSHVLTNFAHFGLLTEKSHKGQVKVPVLVNKGDLSLCGRPALIQSDLQHLQLHVNNSMQKSRGVNNKEMTKKPDLTVFTDKCLQTVSRGERCV